MLIDLLFSFSLPSVLAILLTSFTAFSIYFERRSPEWAAHFTNAILLNAFYQRSVSHSERPVSFNVDLLHCSIIGFRYFFSSSEVKAIN